MLRLEIFVENVIKINLITLACDCC